MSGALAVKSRFEKRLSEATKKWLWQSLMLHGKTNHSARAMTLAYLINRCEKENKSYQLTAHPTLGYELKIITGYER